MPSFPPCARVLRDPEGFKIFFALLAVTLLAGQPRMTKSERALQLCGSPSSRIVPPGLRSACCYPENSFTRSIPDKLVPVGRRLEFPVHDNPLGSIAGQRHATLPACPVARGLQQFSGDAAVTSLGDHVQPLHVSGSPFLKLRQVVANRELGAGQHPAFFIFRYQHSRRLWQCAGEERRDLLVMLRVVPRPHSTPQLFPAQGIVTSDRPNFDADRFFSHDAFPPNLRPRAKTHSDRPAVGHGLEEGQALPVHSRAAASESSRRRKPGGYEVECCEAAAATEKSYSTFFHTRSCPSRRS